MQDEYIQIGRLGKPFGLTGAIKVKIWDEFVGFTPAKNVLFVEQGGDVIPFFFTSFGKQGGHLLVVFEDFDNPNTAHQVAKKNIFVRKQDIPKRFLETEKSEMEDFVGFQIKDESLGVIGSILDYDEGAHQTVILVAYQEREVMIPWVDAYILGVDVDQKIIQMDLPEGLLE